MILDVEARELRVDDGVVYTKRVVAIEITGDDDGKTMLVTFSDGSTRHYGPDATVTISTNHMP